MDNECFELCKEVYKRFPEWDDTQNGYYFVDSREPLLYDNDVFAVKDDDQWWGQMAFLAPQYTSDYLLEKLPPTSVARGVAFSVATRIAATYEQLIGAEGDTPLKALLKLTIALSEAGELK